MDADRLARDLNLLLVDTLVRSGHIRTDAVRAAFTNVQRHHLLPGTNLADAYVDRAITLKTAPAGGPCEAAILSYYPMVWLRKGEGGYLRAPAQGDGPSATPTEA